MTDNKMIVPEDSSTAKPGTNMRSLSMAQVRDVGQVMAMSGMFPDINKDGAKAFVKILAGQEMGIAPFEAMGGISIIQGKATIGGNIMAAKVKGSGKYDYKIRDRSKTGCSIEFFEKNAKGDMKSLGTETFDEADAKAAGLYGKDMWKKYPKNMYFNRAISNGVRTYCPDVLGAGPVYTPEEMGAQVDEDGNAIVAPGVTYTQDQPPAAAALPARAPKITADDEPHDKPLPDDRNPLQLISDDLLEKGIADRAERGQIALAVAEVDDYAKLDKPQWFEIYEMIKAMDLVEIQSFLPDATIEDTTLPAGTDVVADVPDGVDPDKLLDDLGVFDEAPAKKAAAKKKPAVKRPSGEQVAKLLELYELNNIKTDEAKKTFSTAAIGKNFPASYEEYETLIAELEVAE